ncbi:MAG: hypothetical protein M3Q42_06520 [Pseudomonadota bacterium]|nr:hypothetical protein [Pseudomonadota bacterium]
MRSLFRSILVPLVLACTCTAVQAQTADAPQWWGNLNVGSTHFGGEDDFLVEGDSFNEFNPGVGAEVQWQPRHAVAVGYFLNSVDEDSLYALYHYTPLQLGRFVRVGGMIGVVTGYPNYNDGGIAPGAGLIAKVEGQRWGFNLIYLPEVSDVTPNTLGLQLKRRFGP